MHFALSVNLPQRPMVERGANCQSLSEIFQQTAAQLMQKVINFNAGLFVASYARLFVANREAV